MLNNLLAKTAPLLTQREQDKDNLLIKIKDFTQIESIVTNTWVYMLTNIVAKLLSQSGGSYNNYTCYWAPCQIISLVHPVWWENMIDNPDNIIESTPHCLDLNCDQI